MSVTTNVPQTVSTAVTWRTAAQHIGLFALFLICGLLVFAFGVDYHTRFWTNTSGAFKVSLSALFLIAMLVHCFRILIHSGRKHGRYDYLFGGKVG